MTGAFFDDPNREAVGLEPAWAEGYGGSPGATSAPAPQGGEYDDMTKDDMLALVRDRGLKGNATMTKAEIQAVLEAG